MCHFISPVLSFVGLYSKKAILFVPQFEMISVPSGW